MEIAVGIGELIEGEAVDKGDDNGEHETAVVVGWVAPPDEVHAAVHFEELVASRSGKFAMLAVRRCVRVAAFLNACELCMNFVRFGTRLPRGGPVLRDLRIDACADGAQDVLCGVLMVLAMRRSVAFEIFEHGV